VRVKLKMTKRKVDDANNCISDDYLKIASMIFNYDSHMGKQFNINSSSKYILNGIAGLVEYLRHCAVSSNCQIEIFDSEEAGEITYCRFNNDMFKIILLYKLICSPTNACCDGNCGGEKHYENIQYKWIITLM